MNWFFLQIDSAAAAAQAANTVTQTAPEISIMDLLAKGGVLMIPLAVLFVVALFVLTTSLQVTLPLRVRWLRIQTIRLHGSSTKASNV
jgi:hypothetical protein